MHTHKVHTYLQYISMHTTVTTIIKIFFMRWSCHGLNSLGPLNKLSQFFKGRPCENMSKCQAHKTPELFITGHRPHTT